MDPGPRWSSLSSSLVFPPPGGVVRTAGVPAVLVRSAARRQRSVSGPRVVHPFSLARLSAAREEYPDRGDLPGELHLPICRQRDVYAPWVWSNRSTLLPIHRQGGVYGLRGSSRSFQLAYTASVYSMQTAGNSAIHLLTPTRRQEAVSALQVVQLFICREAFPESGGEGGGVGGVLLLIFTRLSAARKPHTDRYMSIPVASVISSSQLYAHEYLATNSLLNGSKSGFRGNDSKVQGFLEDVNKRGIKTKAKLDILQGRF